MLQHDLQRLLHARTLALRERSAAIARPLDPEQLVRRPPDGGWGVGHVLEHLCVTAELYEPPIRALLRDARADAAASLREWKPTLIGGFGVRMFERPTKLPTPKSMAPADTPRGGVVEHWLGHLDTQARLIEDASGYDWRRLRMASPALPLPLKVFNLGDVFFVLVTHAERHARQIERVVATLA
jgi:DinB superfamily